MTDLKIIIANKKRKRITKLNISSHKKKARTDEFYPSAQQAVNVSQALADSCTLVACNVPDKTIDSDFKKTDNDYAIEKFSVNEHGNVRATALALRESKATKRFQMTELNCIRSFFDPMTKMKLTVPLPMYQAPSDLFPDTNTRPQAQERSKYFANSVMQLSTKGDASYIIVLDGPAWRNTLALLGAGADASRIILFEKRNETAIYHRHRALLLGLPIHVIYTGTHQRKAEDGFEGYIRKNLICKIIPNFTNDQIKFIYADYCGSRFDTLIDLFKNKLLPNVELIGITIGKRNRNRNTSIPHLLDHCKQYFNHTKVECYFWEGTKVPF